MLALVSNIQYHLSFDQIPIDKAGIGDMNKMSHPGIVIS